jgi:hypothetical protein
MHHPYSGLVGSKVVIVTISRADIESGNTKPALASLNQLVASATTLEDSNGTISLIISGYDYDPRELHMIGEVRDYFKALDEDFPYWFHVCTRIEHSLRMLFLILVNMMPVTDTAQSGVASAQFANDDLNDFINRHFDAVDNLYAKHGFPEQENQPITALVMNYFQSLLLQC